MIRPTPSSRQPSIEDRQQGAIETKNLAELYDLDRSVVARGGGPRVDQPKNPRRGVPCDDTTRRPAAHGRGRRRVGRREGLLRQRTRDAQEPEPCRRTQLHRLDGAALASDLIFEGRAARVTDAETLERLAKRYAEGGWPARVEDEAFTYDYSAPSAGPPPWNLYSFAPTTVFGVLSEAPGGATRWRFP